jgi:hypothetical protein
MECSTLLSRGHKTETSRSGDSCVASRARIRGLASRIPQRSLPLSRRSNGPKACSFFGRKRERSLDQEAVGEFRSLLRARASSQRKGHALSSKRPANMRRVRQKLEPIPPGEILAEEFMAPHGLSQNRLARDIDVNPARINDMCMAARRSRRRSRCGWGSISVRARSCG